MVNLRRILFINPHPLTESLNLLLKIYQGCEPNDFLPALQKLLPLFIYKPRICKTTSIIVI